jgi:hypothetical protein
MDNYQIAAVKNAKNSLELGIIGLIGSIGSILVLFLFDRVIYLMVLLPIVPVAGIVSGIRALMIEKGLPKAYIGIVLSVLGLIPSVLCTLLFILVMIAR